MPVSINYPGSLDAFPEPDETTYRDDPGYELDVLVAKALLAAETLEAKLGIGATTPDTLHKTVKATAAGTSAWGYYGLVKIAEAAGTGSSGVLTFSSIPAVFRELEVVVVGRSTNATVTTSYRATINGNSTAANYIQQTLQGAATTPSASENIGGVGFIFGGYMPGASATANVHGSSKLWLPEYANTSIYKLIQIFSGGQSNDATGAMLVSNTSALIKLTAAITSVELTLAAGNWATTSRATLYGKPAD